MEIENDRERRSQGESICLTETRWPHVPTAMIARARTPEPLFRLKQENDRDPDTS